MVRYTSESERNKELYDEGYIPTASPISKGLITGIDSSQSSRLVGNRMLPIGDYRSERNLTQDLDTITGSDSHFGGLNAIDFEPGSPQSQLDTFIEKYGVAIISAHSLLGDAIDPNINPEKKNEYITQIFELFIDARVQYEGMLELAEDFSADYLFETLPKFEKDLSGLLEQINQLVNDGNDNMQFPDYLNN